MYTWLLTWAGPLVAQAGGNGTGGTDGGGAEPQPSQLIAWFPLILVLVVFYFLLIRPQRRRDQKRREMLGKIREKDRVVTSGGIQGQVVSISDDEITLRIDARKDIQVKVMRNYIVHVRGADQPQPAPAEPVPPPSP